MPRLEGALDVASPKCAGAAKRGGSAACLGRRKSAFGALKVENVWVLGSESQKFGALIIKKLGFGALKVEEVRLWGLESEKWGL